MRAYTLSELFRLSRSELFALHHQIVAELPAIPRTEHGIALDTLRRIRAVLAQTEPTP